jgi:hypothetical protein
LPEAEGFIEAGDDSVAAANISRVLDRLSTAGVLRHPLSTVG